MIIIIGITVLLIILYLAYPLWLMLFYKDDEKDNSLSQEVDGISLVFLSYNGRQYLEDKISFLLNELSVFSRHELLIVDDNSYDGSRDLLGRYRDHDRIRLIFKDQNKGIPHTMNMAASSAHYEHIIFCDQRQDLSPDIIRKMVAPLKEPDIGAVSACISDFDKQHCCSRIRQHENFLKSRESRTGNLIGVYGPLYAVKKECYSDIPENIILDDLYLSLKILETKRIRIMENCLIFDDDISTLYNYKRTRRYLFGFLQILKARPAFKMLGRRQVVMLFWHKYLRLLIPFFLILSYICIGLLGISHREFLALFGLVTAAGILAMLPLRLKALDWLRTFIRISFFYSVAIVDVLLFQQFSKKPGISEP